MRIQCITLRIRNMDIKRGRQKEVIGIRNEMLPTGPKKLLRET
jgi:hypothetical protein